MNLVSACRSSFMTSCLKWKRLHVSVSHSGHTLHFLHSFAELKIRWNGKSSCLISFSSKCFKMLKWKWLECLQIFGTQHGGIFIDYLIEVDFLSHFSWFTFLTRKSVQWIHRIFSHLKSMFTYFLSLSCDGWTKHKHKAVGNVLLWRNSQLSIWTFRSIDL